MIGGVFAGDDGVFGSLRPGGIQPENLPSNDASAAIAGANGTKPRAIWASINDELIADTSTTSTTQFFATRVKARIAGGKWLAIAPVFVGAYATSAKSPFGTAITAAATISFVLELANGTLTSSYTSPNTGGTVFQGTFNGSVDGILRPGDVLVGDWIYPADVGLTVFEFTDRALLPWCRTAFSKTGASDNLGGSNWSEYNAPLNQHMATCTSYANAKTLITTSGIASYGSGNNFWGANDSTIMPGPIGWIGIAADGQRALLCEGTSILASDYGGNFKQGGVDPANNTIKNYDISGIPMQWAQDITRSIPALAIGMGSSAMFNVFSDTAADISWATSSDSISRQRYVYARFVKWFDVMIAKDVHNDGSASAAYADILMNFTKTVKASNPFLKIYGCKVPNGYVDITGATVAYNTALDVRWDAQTLMVTNGWWNGMLSVRESGSDIYADAGTQVTSTTTSNGSTTTLNDSAATWLTNMWVGSWVEVGGVKKRISSNTRTQLTFDAFAGAVNTATAYIIHGNTSDDGTHPTQYGTRYLAGKFDTAIQAVFPIPKFTRSQ